MAEIKSVPITAKISGLLVLSGFVLFVIGFGTHFWSYSEVYGYATEGLWLGCYESNCEVIFKYGPLPAWLIATQVFECMGAVAAIAAIGLVALYIFVPSTKGKRIVCILSALACFAAAGSILLGIIIYGATVQQNLSWSFAFCIIGAIFFGVASLLLIITTLQGTKKESMDIESRPALDVKFTEEKPEVNLEASSQPLKA